MSCLCEAGVGRVLRHADTCQHTAEIIPLPTTAAECPSVDTGGHPAAGRVGQHRRGSRHLPQ